MTQKKTVPSRRSDLLTLADPIISDYFECLKLKTLFKLKGDSESGKEYQESFDNFTKKYGSFSSGTYTNYKKKCEKELTEYTGKVLIEIATEGFAKAAKEGNPIACKAIFEIFGGYNKKIDLKVEGLSDVALRVLADNADNAKE